MAGDSDTLIPRAGNPSSFNRSTTPAPNPIEMTIDFRLPRPKTVRRNLPYVAPDLDKLIRAVLDALTGVAYVDDGQVVTIKSTKTYGDPGVTITLDTL